MAIYTLDFEKPLLELEKQIEEMKRVAGENPDVAKNIRPLEDQLAALRLEIYKNLTPMQRVQVARHPRRPYPLDYVNTVFTDFVELHGDRLYRDDPAIVGGWARGVTERGRDSWVGALSSARPSSGPGTRWARTRAWGRKNAARRKRSRGV